MAYIRLLGEADLRTLGLTHNDVVSAVEHAYRQSARGLAEVPTKIGVHPDHPNSFSHAMPAWVGGGEPALGVKWISYHPGNLEHKLPDSWGVIVVNDPETGEPVCFMEGMYITFLRTAACAAVMAKRLVAQPQVLGLIGCGGLGKANLAVMRHVFPSLKQVYVSSKKAESRQAFCAEFDSDSCRVAPVDDVGQLLAESDVVVTSLPPVDIPPVQAGMLKDHSVFIPLDVDFSWDPAVVGEFNAFYADNVPYFRALLEKKVGRPNMPDTAILDTQEFVAEHDGPPRAPQGRVFVAVCGIASVDIVIAAQAFHRAVRANIGSFFEIRQS